MKKAIAKVLLVLLPVILLITSVCGCGNGAASGPHQLFIWKVSSATTQVYILGSVHVAKQDIYPLDSTIENAFNSAKYLVVEINSNNLSSDYTMFLLLAYGSYTDGSGFKSHVSAALYNKLDELFAKHDVDLNDLDDFRPFVTYSLMSMYTAEDLGYNADYGIDFYYLDKAAKSNKPIKELESYEFQLSLLSSVPDDTMIAAIAYDIDNPDTGKDLEDLFSAWQLGDTAKLEEISIKPFVDDPELAPYYDILYTGRNGGLLQKIEEYLASDDIHFVVVGAAHLVGENGLLNLLQNKGYNVEQLYSSN
jgi:uncharacterized protein YbaP (TraB family)